MKVEISLHTGFCFKHKKVALSATSTRQLDCCKVLFVNLEMAASPNHELNHLWILHTCYSSSFAATVEDYYGGLLCAEIV